MAAISFTDATGAATLDNGLTGVAGGAGSRFSGWTPRVMPIGPAVHALADGARHAFVFRVDYTAEFSLRDLPATAQAVALRLIAHLLTGGTCSVSTGDNAARTYATCGLAPDSTPSLALQDADACTYTLTLALLNRATPPAPMLCDYA